jgi:hypothetical protein
MSANPSANETNRNEFHGALPDRSPCNVGHFESEHSSSNRTRAHGMQHRFDMGHWEQFTTTCRLLNTEGGNGDYLTVLELHQNGSRRYTNVA